jgi:hypothetical protein
MNKKCKKKYEKARIRSVPKMHAVKSGTLAREVAKSGSGFLAARIKKETGSVTLPHRVKGKPQIISNSG